MLPYGQRQGVLIAINKREQKGLISHVNESIWATLIVVVVKSDAQTPRICGDYVPDLQPSAVQICYYHSGARIFHEIHTHQPKLFEARPDEFLYHHNPRGIFQFDFLPFGPHLSSGVLQAAIDSVIQGLDGVLAYQDDIIIFGATRREHDLRLKSVLIRLTQRDAPISTTKCKFDVFELEFLSARLPTRPRALKTAGRIGVNERPILPTLHYRMFPTVHSIYTQFCCNT